MDPNANLEEQKRIAESLLESEKYDLYDVNRLVELVLCLCDWVRGGGFLPEGLSLADLKIREILAVDIQHNTVRPVRELAESILA